MKAEDMRIKLIKSTIHTISTVGLDRATTKLLAGSAGLNEVYIYRIFGGKDELFKDSFTYIDKQFAAFLLKCFKSTPDPTFPIKENFKRIFYQIWDYSLNDKDNCSYFIRYYYSRYYTKSVGAERKEIYRDVLQAVEDIFKDSSNSWWIFNYMLDVIFSSAVKVLRDEIPNNEQTKEKIFLLLYSAFEPQLK